ncbi:MAG: sigma-70 family RNA polymerase sigma factor [Myxococcota bacterium]|nr:sigma-70 family RNA polymerase sigma factor [Myxococcota bacterium]
MTDASDDRAACLSGLRRGSREAFERVYSQEKAGIYGFLMRLSRDPHVAGDLFQNVWLKLARNARTLREDTDIRAWLFTVARNEYRSYCRAQLLDMSRLLVLGRELASAGVPDGGGDAELAAVEAALGTLGDADRELLLLVCVEGIEARAAAEVLGISYDALRQRLARARKRLSDALEARELPALPERSRST